MINRRINRLDLKLENKSKKQEDEYFTITIDSSGIKKTNGGQWMRKKWIDIVRKNKKDSYKG